MSSFLIKHVKLFFLFILSINSTIYSQTEGIPYDEYAGEIVNEFVREMRKEYDLRCIGRGGSMPNDVESICVMFISNKQSSVDEARKLEVNAIEKLLQLINSNERIRPFLREYPFTGKRAEIIIIFQDNKNKPYSDGSISEISQVHDKLIFRTFDPKTKDHTVLFREPYQEAKKKVYP